jgi:hypothetical protein
MESIAAFASESNNGVKHKQVFDPIAFLNHHFTSEASLVSALPSLRSTLGQRIASLDSAISSAIQRQTDIADQTLTDLARAKTAVTHLQQRVLQVRNKASQSEQAVQEITKDMKRLDTAKRNLSKTITGSYSFLLPFFLGLLYRLFPRNSCISIYTHILHNRVHLYFIHTFTFLAALKQLHMLVHALAQLETAIKAKPFPDYITAAKLVDATWILIGHFEPYIHTVDKMRLLKEYMDLRREELFRGILFGVRVVGFNFQTALEKEGNDKTITTSYSSLPMPTHTLLDACLVVSALGRQRQRDFIALFCGDHLEPYEQLFHPKMTTVPTTLPTNADVSKPTLKKKTVDTDATLFSNPNPASLDQIERRFDWYRRMLRELEHKFPSVFPTSWNVHYHMTFTFLKKTKEHYAILFTSKDGPELFLRDRDSDNVSILLKAFQKTVLFEKEMTAWLQRDYKTDFLDSSVPAAVPNTEAEGEAAQLGPVPRLLGVASSTFDNHMQPYISLEKKNMDELLSKAASDVAVDTRGDRPVFTSSTDLFVYIKNSITRCTALTKGKTFFSLYKVYKDTLKKYALVIAGKLPASNIPVGEEKTVAYVVDTCEYCAETVEALQDLIRDKIDSEYKEKIDMNAEQESFHDASTKAIRLLVSGLLVRLEPGFKEMASINWGTMSTVSDESKYVRSIHDVIQSFVISVSALLPSSYFPIFVISWLRPLSDQCTRILQG